MKQILCPICSKWFKSLGYARHRTMHYEAKLREKAEQAQAEAEQWVEDNGPSGLFGPFPSRSCWICNPAHEGLKQADYPIHCFECGHKYFRGVRLTEGTGKENL